MPSRRERTYVFAADDLIGWLCLRERKNVSSSTKKTRFIAIWKIVRGINAVSEIESNFSLLSLAVFHSLYWEISLCAYLTMMNKVFINCSLNIRNSIFSTIVLSRITNLSFILGCYYLYFARLDWSLFIGFAGENSRTIYLTGILFVNSIQMRVVEYTI